MADAAVHAPDHGKPDFFTRWFCSTNHKDIGILYLITAGIVGLISVAFTMYMRLELMEPGVQYMCLEGASILSQQSECTPNGHLWNVMITGHGILMMFFVVIPLLFGGFGNYFMPLMIGAPDMAFPRMNNISFWLTVAAFVIACISMTVPGGPAGNGFGGGWVLYPPLSGLKGHPGPAMDLLILSLHTAG
ncbi:MAG: cbb3-type cytochrome c oxidase subunit I, partial [Pseudomonadota bacterium]